MIDGKSQAWRDAADELLATLAVENKYLVADMLIIFLESAGYGLDNYTPLGGVFKRAAKKGIIGRIERPGKQALWYSKVYAQYRAPGNINENMINQPIHLEGFGPLDGKYIVADIKGNNLNLKRVTDE